VVGFSLSVKVGPNVAMDGDGESDAICSASCGADVTSEIGCSVTG